MAAVVLTACSPRAVRVEHAWVRLPAVPGRPAAAYFTIQGGAAPATLPGVASPRIGRAELHESMAAGMRPVASVVVMPGASVAFAPAGRHVMLYAVDPAVRPDATVPLRFSFAGGQAITVDATVVGPADPAP